MKRKQIVFKCPKCGLVFKSYQEVLEHYTRMHSFMIFRMKRRGFSL